VGRRSLFGSAAPPFADALRVWYYECGLLSEQKYHRLFGDDLPPLPPHAFRKIEQ